MMRRYLIVSFAALFCLVHSAAVLADRDGRDAGGTDFIGLWQAIDSFDGSTQYLSITCSKRNRCDVRLNDTSFGISCPNPPQTGFARGKGSIKRNVLTVALTLTCEGSDDPIGPQPNDFVLDRRNGTLINLNDDVDPDNPDAEVVPNVFHRISR